MSFAEVMAADAKAAIDEAGESVTYHIGGGASVSIKAVPRHEALGPRGTDDQRSNRLRLMVAVSKSDVAAVQVNDDRVTVPRRWVDAGAAAVETQTLRVSHLESGRTDGSMWVLGLS